MHMHWHDAFKRNPHREARLSYFASGETGSGETPENPDDPLATQVTYGAEGLTTEGQPIRREGEAVQSGRETAREGASRETVEEVSDEARGSIGNVLAPEPPVTIDSVQENVQNTLKKMEKVAQEMQEFQKLAGSVLPKEHYAVWKEDDIALSMYIVHARTWQNTLETIKKWKSGQSSIDGFLHAMEQQYMAQSDDDKGRKEKRAAWKDVRQKIDSYVAERMHAHGDVTKEALARMEGDSAPGSQVSQNIVVEQEMEDIVTDIDNIIPLDLMIREINEHANLLNDALKEAKTEETLKVVREYAEQQAAVADADSPSLLQQLKDLRKVPGKMGIEFYSLTSIYDAYTQLRDAYVETWNNRTRLNGARLANDVSSFLEPFYMGQDVHQVVQSNTQQKNDEVKNKYLDFLKSRNVGFKSLFVESPLMDQNKHDPNRARALLEYACLKGWLYNIDEMQFQPTEEKMIFGKWRLMDLVPPDWSVGRVEEYFYVLLGQNKSGAESEENGTYARVKDLDKPPQFIQNLEAELNGINLWSALGVCKRAMERGLWPEISPWLTTTTYRKLQDPLIRKFIPVTWLDKMGTLGAYRTSFTFGALKAERPNIHKWLKSSDENIGNTGAMGRVIQELEKEIKDKSTKNFKTPDELKVLDHLVAQVLACKTLTDSTPDAGLRAGESISIFDARYDYYRTSGLQEIDPAVPGIDQEDTDYFFAITDNMMVGQAAFDKLYISDGKGSFLHKDKVAHMMANALILYDEIDAVNHDAAERFRREFGTKFTRTINVAGLNDSRTAAMQTVTTVTGPGQSTKHNDRSGLQTLVEEGFFDIRLVFDAVVNKAAGMKMAESLLIQIDKTLSRDTNAAIAMKDGPAKTTKLNDLRQKWAGKMKRDLEVVIGHAQTRPADEDQYSGSAERQNQTAA